MNAQRLNLSSPTTEANTARGRHRPEKIFPRETLTTLAEFVTWLDMPNTRLGLNYASRLHRGAAISMTRTARTDGYLACCFVLGFEPRITPKDNGKGIDRHPVLDPPLWHAVTLRDTFVFPRAGRRDVHNLAGLSKPVHDGMVDAGLLVDDDRIRHEPVEIVVERGSSPMLRVEIWPIR